MQYKFSKCPHCGKFIDLFKPTGWNDLKDQIGPPVGMCLSCMNPYNTGRKYWVGMNGGEKFIIYARAVFGALFGGMAIGMIPLFVLLFLFSKFDWPETNNGSRNAVFACIIIGIIYSTWAHFSELHDLKKIPANKKSPQAKKPTKQADIPTKPTSAKLQNPEQPNLERQLIHYVIKVPEGASKLDPNSLLVTAEAWTSIEPDGERKYKVHLNAGADPFTIIEAHSAIYWRRLLDTGATSYGELSGWLRSLEQLSENKYISTDPGTTEPTEIALFAGLSKASLHYAICRFDSMSYPEAVQSWYRSGIESGAFFSHSQNINTARRIQEALDSGYIDSGFMHHLQSSASSTNVAEPDRNGNCCRPPRIPAQQHESS